MDPRFRGDDDRGNGDDDLGGGNFFGEPDSPKLLAQWVRGAWCRGDIHGALGTSWRPEKALAPGNPRKNRHPRPRPGIQKVCGRDHGSPLSRG